MLTFLTPDLFPTLLRLVNRRCLQPEPHWEEYEILGEQGEVEQAVECVEGGLLRHFHSYDKDTGNWKDVDYPLPSQPVCIFWKNYTSVVVICADLSRYVVMLLDQYNHTELQILRLAENHDPTDLLQIRELPQVPEFQDLLLTSPEQPSLFSARHNPVLMKTLLTQHYYTPLQITEMYLTVDIEIDKDVEEQEQVDELLSAYVQWLNSCRK